jgi:two-component system, chemotaxis family, CheB/CheR fusion protein
MATAADLQSFEDILEHLRQTRGFDFTAYKRASLMRRVLKRMHSVDVGTFEAYLDYLQVHQDEFEALFNTILINVTAFFRDADMWEYLNAHVLPEMLADRPPSSPVRVWSAGCASGQEAYTVAILLAERLGLEGLAERVKIYATDVDNEALTQARHAAFPLAQVADVPPAFLEKYFESDGTTATVNRELRRAVVFGAIDLIQDAPISRVDLLLCRNTLMYFNAEAQTRILNRFAFSLNPNGVLVLGRAEMLFSHSTLFTPVDLKRRLFRVNSKPNSRQRGGAPGDAARQTMVEPVPDEYRLRNAVFDAEPIAQIVLDATGVVVAANGRARHQFAISTRDIGRALQDLEVSYRPAELRSALERAITERRDVALKDVHWSINGDTRYYDIIVAPVFDEQRVLIGSRIAFEDVTRYRVLQSELHASKQELDTAYEELQSTNEELETTNEELQSTVEELETTNEELQSTNEELETMNEELQSTNEELQTTNDEMRSRTLDLDRVNTFFESVFNCLRPAVVVLDRDFRVKVWNPGAKELWGVTSEEALGVNFLALDIGLPVASLGEPMRDVITGARPDAELTLAATTRRGKSIQCKVRLSGLRTPGRNEIAGVILNMEDAAEAV